MAPAHVERSGGLPLGAPAVDAPAAQVRGPLLESQPLARGLERRDSAGPRPSDVFAGNPSVVLPGAPGDWKLQGRTPDGQLSVREQGTGQERIVAPGTLLAANRSLIPHFLEVRVARSNGQVEGNWAVDDPSPGARDDDRVRVVRSQGDRLDRKYIHVDALIQHNPEIVDAVPPVPVLARALPRRGPGPLEAGMRRPGPLAEGEGGGGGSDPAPAGPRLQRQNAMPLHFRLPMPEVPEEREVSPPASPPALQRQEAGDLGWLLVGRPGSPTPAPRAAFAEGQRVTVTRTSGAVESDWTIASSSQAKGSVFVMSPQGITKWISAEKLLAGNPDLLPAGAVVNLRNFGVQGENWKLVGLDGQGGVAAQSPAGESVSLPFESLIFANASLFYPVLPAPAAPPGGRPTPPPPVSSPPSGPLEQPSPSPPLGRARSPLRPFVLQGRRPPAAPSPEDAVQRMAQSLPFTPQLPSVASVRLERVDFEAQVQSVKFLSGHRIEMGERLLDGFFDGGRRAQFDAQSRVDTGREILLIDRTKDKMLRAHIAFAKALEGPPEEKAVLIADYVDRHFRHRDGRELDASSQLARDYVNKGVLIGDVKLLSKGGVCRHRAMMFKVLAEEAGLEVALVRGNAFAHRGPHVWNEVDLKDGRGPRIVDVMNLTYVGDEIRFPKTTEEAVTRDYLDVHDTPMYTASAPGSPLA